MYAQDILDKAKANRSGMRAPGYVDDKQIAEYNEIITLLEAGASIVSINQSVGENFYHTVRYRGHCFINVSSQRVPNPDKYQH